MPLVGFEPTILAGERPQTYTLDRMSTEDQQYWHRTENLMQNM